MLWYFIVFVEHGKIVYWNSPNSRRVWQSLIYLKKKKGIAHFPPACDLRYQWVSCRKEVIWVSEGNTVGRFDFEEVGHWQMVMIRSRSCVALRIRFHWRTLEYSREYTMKWFVFPLPCWYVGVSFALPFIQFGAETLILKLYLNLKNILTVEIFNRCTFLNLQNTLFIIPILVWIQLKVSTGAKSIVS